MAHHGQELGSQPLLLLDGGQVLHGHHHRLHRPLPGVDGRGVEQHGDAPPDGYIVHIRPEGGAEGSGRTKTPKAKKTRVSFDNLEAGQTYKVWVRAENEAGKGERVHASITLPEAEPEQQDQGEQGDGQQNGQSGQ